MSMKSFAAKAAGIRLTEAERDAAGAKPSAPPSTAPGQLMGLQAKMERQAALINELRAAQGATEIELRLIDEVPGRRRRLTPTQYDELKANLEQNRLLQPVVLLAKTGGRFELVAGHNRTAIYRDLKRDKITARIVDLPHEEVARYAFFSNLLAPSLSDFEKLLNFQQLISESSVSRNEIAQLSGLSRAHIDKIFSFEGLPAEAQEILRQKPERLGSNAAQKLSALAKSGNPEKVIEAVKRLVENDTFTQEQAVSLAAVKTVRPTAAPTKLVVKSGKKHICDLIARNGVVGVSFKGADPVTVDRWMREIHAFIEARLKEE